MITLQDAEISNFLSYGNYITRLDLSDRKQCFITGEIEGFDDENKASNGAGKSSLMQAVLWCLTGRTMHNRNPGNKILNWFTDDDCIVKLRFQTGEILTRVRRRKGETDLLFQRNGDDVINSTLSTTANMQKLLDKELNFDWDVFCGSVFCSQYNKPWLEMSDVARKSAFERITGIDRLSTYATVAKTKRDKAELHQGKIKSEVSIIESTLSELQENIDSAKEKHGEFEQDQLQKQRRKLAQAKECQEKAENLKQVNLDKLKKKWGIVQQVNVKIKELRTQKSDIDKRIIALKDEKAEAAKTLANQLFQALHEFDGEKDDLVSDHKKELNELQHTKNGIEGEIAKLDAQIEFKRNKIEFWEEKKGAICIECEQPIQELYRRRQIEPIKESLSDITKSADDANNSLSKCKRIIAGKESDIVTQIDEMDIKATNLQKQNKNDIAKSDTNYDDKIEKLEAKRTKIENTIETAEDKLADSTPKITIKEAEAENSQKDQLLEQANGLREEAEEIMQEENPHTHHMSKLEKQLSFKQKKLDMLQGRVKNFNVVYQHLQYMYRSYSDRKKIKSYLISRHIPYFNNRLHHYLDSFQLDIKIELTESLGITSTKWGYEFFSGGERKRFDVAFMFAVMDLHRQIHGQQCNVLVLDEVDGRLDEAGIENLIGVIKNDLANKFESIFIISHRQMMRDVFPNNLVVRRRDRFSQLSAVA